MTLFRTTVTLLGIVGALSTAFNIIQLLNGIYCFSYYTVGNEGSLPYTLVVYYNNYKNGVNNGLLYLPTKSLKENTIYSVRIGKWTNATFSKIPNTERLLNGSNIQSMKYFQTTFTEYGAQTLTNFNSEGVTNDINYSIKTKNCRLTKTFNFYFLMSSVIVLSAFLASTLIVISLNHSFNLLIKKFCSKFPIFDYEDLAIFFYNLGLNKNCDFTGVGVQILDPNSDFIMFVKGNVQETDFINYNFDFEFPEIFPGYRYKACLNCNIKVLSDKVILNYKDYMGVSKIYIFETDNDVFKARFCYLMDRKFNYNMMIIDKNNSQSHHLSLQNITEKIINGDKIIVMRSNHRITILGSSDAQLTIGFFTFKSILGNSLSPSAIVETYSKLVRHNILFFKELNVDLLTKTIVNKSVPYKMEGFCTAAWKKYSSDVLKHILHNLNYKNVLKRNKSPALKMLESEDISTYLIDYKMFEVEFMEDVDDILVNNDKIEQKPAKQCSEECCLRNETDLIVKIEKFSSMTDSLTNLNDVIKPELVAFLEKIENSKFSVRGPNYEISINLQKSKIQKAENLLNSGLKIKETKRNRLNLEIEESKNKIEEMEKKMEINIFRDLNLGKLIELLNTFKDILEFYQNNIFKEKHFFDTFKFPIYKYSDKIMSKILCFSDNIENHTEKQVDDLLNCIDYKINAKGQISKSYKFDLDTKKLIIKCATNKIIVPKISSASRRKCKKVCEHLQAKIFKIQSNQVRIVKNKNKKSKRSSKSSKDKTVNIVTKINFLRPEKNYRNIRNSSNNINVCECIYKNQKLWDHLYIRYLFLFDAKRIISNKSLEVPWMNYYLKTNKYIKSAGFIEDFLYKIQNYCDNNQTNGSFQEILELKRQIQCLKEGKDNSLYGTLIH